MYPPPFTQPCRFVSDTAELRALMMLTARSRWNILSLETVNIENVHDHPTHYQLSAAVRFAELGLPLEFLFFFFSCEVNIFLKQMFLSLPFPFMA